MTQGEDVIGESGGVGVMLFDVEIGFVIQQAVEHVCGVPHGGASLMWNGAYWSEM